MSRRRLSASAPIVASIGIVAALFSGCAPLTPPPAGERIIRDLVYYTPPDGRDLRLDIYQPSGPGPFPLVMWIHGGGWKYGNKGWRLLLRDLTSRGFTVASIEYRLSNRDIYPAQFQDCRTALEWLVAHGREYRFDTNNIFLAGDSAGGQLAAMLGLEQENARIRGVCGIYPVADVADFPDKDITRGYVPELLGGSIRSRRKLADSASPIHYVTSKAPPFHILHGDQDTLVPIRQSERFHAKLRGAAVESTLVVAEGEGHGFTPNSDQVAAVADFFTRHLKP